MLYRSKTKRRFELGGFKAGEKLASDLDLPATNELGATVVGEENGRVGSWKLCENICAEDSSTGSSALQKATQDPASKPTVSK